MGELPPRRPAIPAHRPLPDRPDRYLGIEPTAGRAAIPRARGQAGIADGVLLGDGLALVPAGAPEKNVKSLAHPRTIQEQIEVNHD